MKHKPIFPLTVLPLHSVVPNTYPQFILQSLCLFVLLFFFCILLFGREGGYSLNMVSSAMNSGKCRGWEEGESLYVVKTVEAHACINCPSTPWPLPKWKVKFLFHFPFPVRKWVPLVVCSISDKVFEKSVAEWMHSLLSLVGRNFSVVKVDYLLRVLIFSHSSPELINWIGHLLVSAHIPWHSW